MPLRLCNPDSQAHLEDLRERLFTQLVRASQDPCPETEAQALIERLMGVVRSMDRGETTTKEALAIFARQRVPGFSFAKWLVDMADEGVYTDTTFRNAV